MNKTSLRCFHWHGQNGQGKPCRGKYLARSEQEVIAHLKQRNIVIKMIQSRPADLVSKWRNRFTIKDIHLFTRQLATLLMSSVPLSEALRLILIHHQKAEMRSLLTEVQQAVIAGIPLSIALKNASHHFDSLYISLVKSAEQHGQLADVFNKLSQYLEQKEQLRQKLLKAMIYPLLIVLVASIVCYIMLVFVIPQFADLFQSFGAQLPWLTQQVIALSNWLADSSVSLLLSVFFVVISLRTAQSKSPTFNYYLAKLALSLPIFGRIWLRSELARFCSTTATSLRAGISILAGLQMASESVSNQYLLSLLPDIITRIANGETLHQSLRRYECFPETLIQLTMIGEESGRLEEMLSRVALLYEQDVTQRLETLEKLMEPVLILLLGIVIGGLVIAMYLPIFNLASILS